MKFEYIHVLAMRAFPSSPMETTSFIFLIIFILVPALILLRHGHSGNKLPPGPSLLLRTLLLLTNSLADLEPTLKNLKSKYGPLINLSIGSRPSLLVTTHSLAHQILIEKGAIFSDRPKSFHKARNIAAASYGPIWRLLRRNLATEVLHPARLKSYSGARKRALLMLINSLQDHKVDPNGIKVVDHFHHAMFSLLASMSFGENLDEDCLNEIASLQHRLLVIVSSGRFSIVGIYPRLGKLLLLTKVKELLQISKDTERILIPLIKSRMESIKSNSLNEQRVAYVDTLMNLELPKDDGAKDKGGKLTDRDIVSMCCELFNAGTDTTTTTLQWIMANLVTHPHIQKRLYDEIVEVVGTPPPLAPLESFVKEEDLQKMPYLKAVVLEGLRRHPPGRFVLPHRVTKEVEVEGYTIPEGATINFMMGEMALDPEVWDEPLEFKPERFLANNVGDGVFDITGNKGIKMMPFGAGRRICPGSNLAILHLEYFVANLIWYFHWDVPDGCHVDLSEKIEFTIVMKNPLRVQISSRDETMNNRFPTEGSISESVVF